MRDHGNGAGGEEIGSVASGSAVFTIADDRAAVAHQIEGASIVPLAMALVHLTGDLGVLDEIEPYVQGAWEHLASVPAGLAANIRSRILTELERLEGGRQPAMTQPTSAIMQRMMSVAVGEAVHEEYVPMLMEHMSIDADRTAIDSQPQQLHSSRDGFKVAVIGAGASGLCAAIRLGERGISYTVFEKNEDVGGTWFENRYPGCAVDTPNHFYQFSFEPNDEWPHYFSRQASIRNYLTSCSDKYGVRANTRFGWEIVSATWDENAKLWVLRCKGRNGEVEIFNANAVVCAVGQLNRPSLPAIPGMEEFEGKTLHTAAWPEGTDLRGKKVALVGTGASAVQVGPAIVNEVASLHVFQRSGSWVARRPNIDSQVSEGKKWALRNIPFYAAWYRFQLFWAFGDGLFDALRIDPDWNDGGKSISAVNSRLRETMLRHMRKELEGRDDLLAKVVPDYPPFGKRVLGDAGWFKMLRRDHVTLETGAIQRITTNSIQLAGGESVPVDAIIFATGFQAGRMLWPMDVRGRSGTSIRELWGDDNPRAYLGITVPDFPNFFILFGPNTNLGHGGSAIFLAECQVRYTMGLIDALVRGEGDAVECRQDVHDQYNAEIDAKLQQLCWSHPSVTTWYKNANGRIVTNQPWRLVDYWRLTHSPDYADYFFS